MNTITRDGEALARLRSALLAPRGVAVLGASDEITRPGGRLVAALVRHGFQGGIYPVNPNRTTVQGIECFRRVSDAPGPVDVAIVLIAASRVLEALEDCAQAGVSLAVIGSAGFSESGPEGAALEQEVRHRAHALGVRIIGPNTNGLVIAAVNMAASFTPALQQDDLTLSDGPTAIVAQSGALGGALLGIAQATGLAAGTMINTGNELDVTYEEILELVVDPAYPATSILGYVEGFRDAARLVGVARSAYRSGTAVTLLKVGVSESGAAAAAAHTAKLAGSDRVFSGVMNQLGVARAATLEELLDIGRIRMASVLPGRRRITVASLSGGAGIISVDLAQAAGLELAAWSQDEQDQLNPWLPVYLSKSNPIDLAGGPFWDLDKLAAILRVVDDHADTDINVLVLANFEAEQDRITDALIEQASELRKPLIVVWVGMAARSLDRLNQVGVPAFPEPARAIAALGKVTRVSPGSIVTGAASEPPEPRRGAGAILAAADGALNPREVRSLLAEYGIPFVAEQSLAVGERPAAEAVALPAVAKLNAASLEHKSDLGAVKIHLSTIDELWDALGELESLAARLQLADAELVVQREIPAGVELLLGMSHDAVFGRVISLGIGGVFAEALDDIVVRLPHLDADDVATALSSLRTQALLRGYRQLPEVDPAAIAAVVLSFCELVNEIGDQFEAIDLNPIIVPPGEPPVAVDALFIRAADPLDR
jgi:acyl-CoA synthetase (NDP forming)